MTKTEVADVLGVSVRTVDRLRSRGLLPGFNVLASIRFRIDDVEAFIEGRRRAEPDSR
jgi:excisionase family DNA binding protein